jgi:hypothetical protein
MGRMVLRQSKDNWQQANPPLKAGWQLKIHSAQVPAQRGFAAAGTR